MSSNIRVIKICEYCNNEFIAKKTTSKCCSDDCAKRFYKLKIKKGKIAHAELKTEIRRRPHLFYTEDEIKAINAKQNLTLKEAAFILNVSPLTLRRWIFFVVLIIFGKVHRTATSPKDIFICSCTFKRK